MKLVCTHIQSVPELMDKTKIIHDHINYETLCKWTHSDSLNIYRVKHLMHVLIYPWDTLYDVSDTLC